MSGDKWVALSIPATIALVISTGWGPFWALPVVTFGLVSLIENQRDFWRHSKRSDELRRESEAEQQASAVEPAEPL